jgi:hypothetical protein
VWIQFWVFMFAAYRDKESCRVSLPVRRLNN